MMNYFITGGCGFLASHLIDKLSLDNNNNIIAFDNLFHGKLLNIQHHLDKNRIEFIYGDIRNYELLKSCINDVDIVFHLAAQSNVVGSITDPDYCFETNVIGTYNVLKACKEKKVNKIVFSSSREVYGNALTFPVSEEHPLLAKNVYGASKIAGEAYCRVFENLYGIDISILRFSNIYGKRDRDRVIPIWLDEISKNKDIKIYGGNQIIDFIYIDYAIKALIKVSEINLHGLPINIGSGMGTKIIDLAEYIKSLFEKDINIIKLPSRDFEVNEFIANNVRMQEILHIIPPASSLSGLMEMVV